MRCYEGELIHRFGSSSLDREQDTDTFLPRNSLSVALNHPEDHVPRSIDPRMLRDAHSLDAREREDRGRGTFACCYMQEQEGKRNPRRGFLLFALSKASEQRSDRAPRPRGRTTKWYPTEILCVHTVFADYVTPRQGERGWFTARPLAGPVCDAAGDAIAPSPTHLVVTCICM